MVYPKDVVLDPDLVKATLAHIDARLSVGDTSVFIEDNQNLLSVVKEHYKTAWAINSKGYVNRIKLWFTPEIQDDAEILIEKAD